MGERRMCEPAEPSPSAYAALGALLNEFGLTLGTVAAVRTCVSRGAAGDESWVEFDTKQGTRRFRIADRAEVDLP